jgi:hypothetical protein
LIRKEGARIRQAARRIVQGRSSAGFRLMGSGAYYHGIHIHIKLTNTFTFRNSQSFLCT